MSSAVVLAASLALVPAHAGVATSAPRRPALAVRSPQPAATILTRRHLLVAGAVVSLRGTARKRETVEVTTSCVPGMACGARVTADRKGRWKAAVRIVVPRTRSRQSFTVRSGASVAGVGVRLAPRAEPAPAGTPPLLAVIGDSLAEGTADLLPGAAPEFQASTEARVSRPLAEGMALLEVSPLPRRPLVLVMGMFTNDDPRGVDRLDAAVRRSVQVVGERGCVVWATIARPPVAKVSFRAANERLHALAADPSLAGRLIVAPWAEQVREHREWLARDRVHATPEGYVARAQMLAEAARSCGAVR